LPPDTEYRVSDTEHRIPDTGMVSLVIVSHSHLLAEGVREIALQMATNGVRIGAVGGLVEDDRSVLGTDAARIAAAVREQWCDDGVLLLVDLGSAGLSAELALDLLSPEQAARCLISNAPLVEGAIVAAVEASLGRSLADVNAAAEAACHLQKH
jgi:dihydroxyacetone kinase phosphotransfer subunit